MRFTTLLASFLSLSQPQKPFRKGAKKLLSDKYDGIEPPAFQSKKSFLAVLGIEPRLKRTVGWLASYTTTSRATITASIVSYDCMWKGRGERKETYHHTTCFLYCVVSQERSSARLVSRALIFRRSHELPNRVDNHQCKTLNCSTVRHVVKCLILLYRECRI
jgi:hypothetical protein